METENLVFTIIQVRKKILDNKYKNMLSGMVIIGLVYKLNSQ